MLTRIVNTVSAFIMLVSTTGMTVNMHFCMDRLYAVGINRPAESCCEKGNCPIKAGAEPSNGRCRHGFAIDKPDHCSNRSIHISNTDDYVVFSSSADLTASVQQVTLPGIAASATLFDSHESPAVRTAYKYCNPPPLKKTDLSVIQAFLI